MPWSLLAQLKGHESVLRDTWIEVSMPWSLLAQLKEGVKIRGAIQ